LFEIPAQDPVTLAVAGTTLALVALGACYVPAARATRINPTVALRSE
jgi:putative ABC transport system permease protein